MLWLNCLLCFRSQDEGFRPWRRTAETFSLEYLCTTLHKGDDKEETSNIKEGPATYWSHQWKKDGRSLSGTLPSHKDLNSHSVFYVNYGLNKLKKEAFTYHSLLICLLSFVLLAWLRCCKDIEEPKLTYSHHAQFRQWFQSFPSFLERTVKLKIERTLKKRIGWTLNVIGITTHVLKCMWYKPCR